MTISIIGLGYVGLPLALCLSEQYEVIGYDVDDNRIASLKQGIDSNQELKSDFIRSRVVSYTSHIELIRQASVYIIAVPTDIDSSDQPDLSHLIKASQTVGGCINKGDLVIYESTVYPGCTEEVCIPILESQSGLNIRKDFQVAYSPERIVPGQIIETLINSIKIVGANDHKTADRVCAIYEQFLGKPCHRVSSIKAAEATKILENTQRDLNISLMNEMAIILDKMDIDSGEVINAAATKWNFHPYKPGLVGGHCISVDPLYLIHKAKQLGHIPQVIAAGRRVNDYIPKFIATKVAQTLINNGINPGNSTVLIMGLSFKENVADIRNSRTIELIHNLQEYSIEIHTVDPGIQSFTDSSVHFKATAEIRGEYDAIVIAVSHEVFKDLTFDWFEARSMSTTILFDVKGLYTHFKGKENLIYWSL